MKLPGARLSVTRRLQRSRLRLKRSTRMIVNLLSGPWCSAALPACPPPSTVFPWKGWGFRCGGRLRTTTWAGSEAGADERPLATQWKDAGLDRLHVQLLAVTAGAAPGGGETLLVRTRMSAADKQYGVLVDYTWSSDGASVGLRTQVRPEGEWCDGVSGPRSRERVQVCVQLNCSSKPGLWKSAGRLLC